MLNSSLVTVVPVLVRMSLNILLPPRTGSVKMLRATGLLVAVTRVDGRCTPLGLPLLIVSSAGQRLRPSKGLVFWAVTPVAAHSVGNMSPTQTY